MPQKLMVEKLKLLKRSGYSKKAIEYFIDKVNVGVLENPDLVKTHAGPCGDILKLFLKVDKGGFIEDAKFCYLGCPGSASSASAMTKLVQGKTIDEARRLSEEDILKELGGLPTPKIDCPTLAITTLREAIEEYEKKGSSSES